jgi:hypothetical protein
MDVQHQREEHMPNPNNETNQEHTTFYDQADEKFNKVVEKVTGHEDEINPAEKDRLTSKVTSDDDENAGSTYSKNLMNRADAEVRENEDASLQDDTYAFDSDNLGNEDYHDVGDVDADYDFDNDDDFIQERE